MSAAKIAERPILFSGPLVCAILEGEKTQTRRPLKMRGKAAALNGLISKVEKGKGPLQWCVNASGLTAVINCPYGAVGDRLWVRERFAIEPQGPDEYPLLHFAADGRCCGYDPRNGAHGWTHEASPPYDGKWKPSIHMPRVASRILLEVTKVRLVRLRDITDDDALAEGMTGEPCAHEEAGHRGCTDCYNTGWLEPPRVEFMQAWNGIHGPDNWDENPWVWAVSFKRLKAES